MVDRLGIDKWNVPVADEDENLRTISSCQTILTIYYSPFIIYLFTLG